MAELLEKLLQMMNCSNIKISWEKLYEEGGTDEILQTEVCGRCGNSMAGQVFADYKHICKTCRAKSDDLSGVIQYEQHMKDLEKRGKKWDDVLGEVDINNNNY